MRPPRRPTTKTIFLASQPYCTFENRDEAYRRYSSFVFAPRASVVPRRKRVASDLTIHQSREDADQFLGGFNRRSSVPFKVGRWLAALRDNRPSCQAIRRERPISLVKYIPRILPRVRRKLRSNRLDEGEQPNLAAVSERIEQSKKSRARAEAVRGGGAELVGYLGQALHRHREFDATLSSQ